jgi:hypothetical protein
MILEAACCKSKGFILENSSAYFMVPIPQTIVRFARCKKKGESTLAATQLFGELRLIIHLRCFFCIGRI